MFKIRCNPVKMYVKKKNVNCFYTYVNFNVYAELYIYILTYMQNFNNMFFSFSNYFSVFFFCRILNNDTRVCTEKYRLTIFVQRVFN